MLRNEEVRRYVSRALLVLIPALALVVAVYVLRHRRKVAQGRQEG